MTRILCQRSVLAALAVIALSAVTGCVPGPKPHIDPTPGPVDTTGAPATTSPAPEPVPRGEIWQWAIGKNMNDPELDRYMRGLSQDDIGGGAMVQSEGFELKLDSSGTVYGVTLFNDENRLGFTGGNTFRAYRGQLPGGLSWSMTARQVVDLLGEPDQAYTAGFGVELSFTYRDVGGYTLTISLAARHQSEMWTSAMHTVDVSPA